jgi:rhamnogalacturonan endolyase
LLKEILIVLLSIQAGSYAVGQTLLYEADFEKGIDKTAWIVEAAPGEDSVLYAKDGKLVIDSKGGITVWLNKRLKGNIQIEYDRTVLIDGKKNDRLSDLNQFWMAQDPRNAKLFTRKGAFEEYDSLQLYYVGMGGNSNTTTRFRKYDGKGNRVLLQEYTEASHLLKPNKKYKIKIIVQNGTTSFWMDGECYIRYNDPQPLHEGYFGFRSTHSRQEVSGFKVYRLP